MKSLMLTDILLLYEEYLTAHNPQKATSILIQLRTALDRFTLPGWGFPPFAGGRPTKAEQAAAQQFKQTLNLEHLSQALQAQALGFELLKPSESSQAAYKSILKKFLDWCDHQSWCAEDQRAVNTGIRRGHGSVTAGQTHTFLNTLDLANLSSRNAKTRKIYSQ